MKFLKLPFSKGLVIRRIFVGITALSAVTPSTSAAQSQILVSKENVLCIIENADSYLKRVNSDVILIFANFCPGNMPDRAALSELPIALGVPDLDPGSDDKTEQAVFALSRSQLRCLSESEGAAPFMQSSGDLIDVVKMIEEICEPR